VDTLAGHKFGSVGPVSITSGTGSAAEVLVPERQRRMKSGCGGQAAMIAFVVIGAAISAWMRA
jgi:hypothetical protein